MKWIVFALLMIALAGGSVGVILGLVGGRRLIRDFGWTMPIRGVWSFLGLDDPPKTHPEQQTSSEDPAPNDPALPH